MSMQDMSNGADQYIYGVLLKDVASIQMYGHTDLQ